MNTAFILDFLTDLQRNNSKIWMDAHRERYLEAKQHFLVLVNYAIDQLQTIDPSLHGVTAQESLFRINKNDFSRKGEAPYKGRIGAGISKGGRLSPYANYILVLEPGDRSRVGGGMPNPKKEQLELIREEIDYSPGELEQIMDAPEFKHMFGSLRGDKLTSAPKGYNRQHPSIELLKHKNFLALRYFTDAEVVHPDFIQQLLPTYKAVKPLQDFLNRTVT